MTYSKITATTVVEVPNYKSLAAVWRDHGPVSRLLVGRWRVSRLTRSQHKRLPVELKRRLQVVRWA
jgi:hypothetical protein